MRHQTIVVIDFGSQYTQLIARRLRELSVYSEIVPPTASAADIAARRPAGIILSGGPRSVSEPGAPHTDPAILELGTPTLGICYGMMLMTQQLGGTVSPASSREYGHAVVSLGANGRLFRELPPSMKVWASHGDYVAAAPPGFEVTATSSNAPVAAIQDVTRHLYGLLFHPEVVHTERGEQLLRNFVYDVCGCVGDWTMASFVEESVGRIRAQVGASGRVVCGLSGGVDSTVAAMLVHKAIGDRLTCVFVDNGLLRLNEAEQVRKRFERLNLPLDCVDAVDLFLDRLASVTDPEKKRKVIGAAFIDVFEKRAIELGGFDYLAQGTLYPDVIESVSVVGPSAAIKSHHNVGGLPERMHFKLVEPLRQLFKDEVRAVGTTMGLEDEFVWRQPFPGPGLAVRLLGPITRERLDLLRRADAIIADEIRQAGWYRRLWQSFAVLLPVQSVGVMGDGRTYEHAVALRAVESRDGMTADWARLPHDLLAQISSRIVNEVRGINRVVYDISSKPPATIEWGVMNEFVHLHLHTEFSLLDGACRVNELLDRAAALKMPAVAVTEHGNLFSAVSFHDAARKRGVKPILGCEVYVAPGDRTDRSGTPGETANHLVLLAETNEGFHNLIKLVSSGYTEGFYYKPRIDKALLAAHARGLIGLSSCLKGEVATGIRTDQAARARAAAATYRDILGAGNFFLEMQDQGIDEQRIVNTGLLPIARDLGMPLVCTNDVHYLHQADQHPHDVLLCIGTGKSVSDEKRLKYHGDQFFLKTADEMATVFGAYPEAMRNTMAIAERCNVLLPSGEAHLPAFPVPAGYTVDSYFEEMTRAGFAERLPLLQAQAARGELRRPLVDYEARLKYEIDMIRRMNYAGYFLIVWDFIRYARELGIPVGPGRGSAAGSIVAYCLRITDVDPLHFDLYFERFLNPERVSLPDIDIDFCERRRGEVITYVTAKYGRENVAQIITFGTMKARAVVRDVGRVMEMSVSEVDRVAKLIPNQLEMTLDTALVESPPLAEAERSDERVRSLLAVARRLEGMTRHASVHAAGVVIAPRPLIEFVPLYKSAKDEITTQWAMKEIERVGLLKMDFLGLSTLTLLDDAVKHIKATTGDVIDLDRLPLDDARTYQVFQNGQTHGVFQFESSGMRDVLRKAKPQCLEDLIALNALYRPGPLRGGVVDDYINRKHGRVEIRYELPQMESVLKETYGVIAYQEQVMRLASELAGFTLGQADELRRAMGKKDAAKMQAQREAFMAGCRERGIAEKKASKVFEFMEFFAGYGFNKSHSTTYALLAYQTVYLKANYPRHFMAALLTIESENSDKIALYLDECRELGVPVLPPDINRSELPFVVQADGVRFGLGAVKGAGQGAIHSILDARRESGGTIPSLFALVEKMDLRLVNKKVLEALVKAGAFDTLAAGGREDYRAWRARLVAGLDRVLDHGGRHQRDRSQGQERLFGGGAEADESSDDEAAMPAVRPWTETEALAGEKESLGLYMSGHPLQRYADSLVAAGAKRLSALTQSEADVSIGGGIGGLRLLKTRRGDRMAVFMLEAEDGKVEAVVYPEAFGRYQSLIVADAMVLARGKYERDEETSKLVVAEIIPLEVIRERAVREVEITLSGSALGKDLMRKVAAVLERHPGDRRVSFVVRVNGAGPPLRVRAATARKIKPTDLCVREIEAVCGAGSVLLK